MWDKSDIYSDERTARIGIGKLCRVCGNEPCICDDICDECDSDPCICGDENCNKCGNNPCTCDYEDTAPPVQIAKPKPESFFKKKTTIIALIAATPLLIVLVVVIVFFARLDNRNPNIINYVEIIRILPNPNGLSGQESIAIGLHVSREGLRLGRQEVGFSLRSSNGTVVDEGSTMVYLSSGRSSHQTVELFTHYFALGSEYELMISLNGTPMQLFALFGWL